MFKLNVHGKWFYRQLIKMSEYELPEEIREKLAELSLELSEG